MLGFFPTPYNDEILYSILARYHKRVGTTSITSTIEDLFGTKKLTAIVDLPCNLGSLISTLTKDWNISFSDLVYCHSLFPFYVPFWEVERANSILEMMKEKSKRSIHVKAGTNANKLSSWKYLRYCPVCFEEDEIKYGEAYWRRLHQIPGILVCPYHKEIILNSSAQVYASNQMYFQTANTGNCISPSPTTIMEEKVLEKFVVLSQDVMWLLSSNLLPRSYDWYMNTYKQILREKGFVSHKGYVRQDSLISEFINYYSPDFLNTLDILPDQKKKHNWMSMMSRKNKDCPHPIEHLLFIRFLGCSVPDFFNQPLEKKCVIKTESNKQLYPCLNAAAGHYKQLVVSDINTGYSRNKNLITTYTCKCGFVYTRVSKGNVDIFRYDSVKFYGIIWENKLKELVEEKELHLREVAIQLNIDLKTVRKRIARLGLYSKWVKKRIEFYDTQKTDLAKLEKSRENYRTRWIELTNSYNGFSKTALCSISRNLFYWLNKYDKEWLNQNSPSKVKQRKILTRVDWEERDKQLKVKIEETVNYLLSNKHKPVRITNNKIGKELGMTYSLSNHLDKMPISKKVLVSVCENVEDYRIRRIKLAVEKLKTEGCQIKAWKIKQLTGLNKVNSSYVENAIKNEVLKYYNDNMF